MGLIGVYCRLFLKVRKGRNECKIHFVTISFFFAKVIFFFFLLFLLMIMILVYNSWIANFPFSHPPLPPLKCCFDIFVVFYRVHDSQQAFDISVHNRTVSQWSLNPVNFPFVTRTTLRVNFLAFAGYTFSFRKNKGDRLVWLLIANGRKLTPTRLKIKQLQQGVLIFILDGNLHKVHIDQIFSQCQLPRF